MMVCERDLIVFINEVGFIYFDLYVCNCFCFYLEWILWFRKYVYYIKGNFYLVSCFFFNVGMNIVCVLGDKFLKEEESVFFVDFYISNVFRFSGDGLGLVVMVRYVYNFCVLCIFNIVVYLNLCVYCYLLL